VGGFDESFGRLGGEDTDLGLRALDSGTPKRFAPDALVWHAVEQRSFGAALRDSRRWVDAPLLYSRHPDQRRQLRYGVFLQESHARLLLALAGALTRRPLVAAVAALPYVELHLRHYRRSPLSLARAGVHLPARAAADLAETLTMARGAVRHRTLVL
jgi:GT2 family glycosyltransferase